MADVSKLLEKFLGLLPISEDEEVGELDVKIFRLSDRLLDIEFARQGNIKPIYVLLLIENGVALFKWSGWLTNAIDRQKLGIDRPEVCGFASPSGKEIEDVSWVCVASRRQRHVSWLGNFRGRFFFSPSKNYRVSCYVELLKGYWRVIISILIWLSVVVFLGWLNLKAETTKEEDVKYRRAEQGIGVGFPVR